MAGQYYNVLYIFFIESIWLRIGAVSMAIKLLVLQKMEIFCPAK
jgi:hypothetical protein